MQMGQAQSAPAPTQSDERQLGNLQRTKPPKNAFLPFPEQQRVHALITAAEYQGKDAGEFIAGLIKARAVRFKPLPGVLLRLFDFAFGSRGLSLMHLKSIRTSERSAWQSHGGSNFSNLSSNAEFAVASQPTSIADIIDACRSLSVFSHSYWNETTCFMVDALSDFLHSLSISHTWTLEDLPDLVYWANEVLEDFRSAILISPQAARDVSLRCSSNDQLLRDLMFEMQENRINRLSQLPPPPPAHSDRRGSDRGPQRQPRTASNPSRQDLGPIPQRVLDVIPVQKDADGTTRQLCMRYLSKMGCSSRTDGQCRSARRGHFVPASLDALVKAEIIRRYGGLKPEHAQL